MQFQLVFDGQGNRRLEVRAETEGEKTMLTSLFAYPQKLANGEAVNVSHVFVQMSADRPPYRKVESLAVHFKGEE